VDCVAIVEHILVSVTIEPTRTCLVVVVCWWRRFVWMVEILEFATNPKVVVAGYAAAAAVVPPMYEARGEVCYLRRLANRIPCRDCHWMFPMTLLVVPISVGTIGFVPRDISNIFGGAGWCCLDVAAVASAE
jgi:hypothetical protein